MTARKQKKQVWKAWGGFTDNELDMGIDMWKPAIFRTRAEARLGYDDVRRVTITLTGGDKP